MNLSELHSSASTHTAVPSLSFTMVLGNFALPQHLAHRRDVHAVAVAGDRPAIVLAGVGAERAGAL